MAVRIFEEAWSGNISGNRTAISCHRRERDLWHRNMPNIRIALAISRSQYHLYAEVLNCASYSMAGKPETSDDPALPPDRAGTQAAYAGGQARARRGRSAQAGCRGKRQAGGREGVSGPEGPGADPLWRLGDQGHRLGFLRALNKKPRDRAAFHFGSDATCATTTVVPTETRWYRSVISAFSMRMQP